MADASQIAQYLANGVIYGSIIALAAIGLSLIYGILNLSNFAQGDFLALGAFLALTFGIGELYRDEAGLIGAALALVLLAAVALDALKLKRLSTGERASIAGFAAVLLVVAAVVAARGPYTGTTNLLLVLAALLSVLLTVVFVLGLEFALWRPLRRRKATVLTLIIVSIGVALVLRNTLVLKFGASIRSFERPTAISDRFFGIAVSDAQQITLLVTVVLGLAVHALLTYTRVGKAMRAVRDNPDLARVSGIDVDRVIVYVWVLGGALTAVAGVLWSLANNNTMNANMGAEFLLPLFAAVILGGVGSAYGAIAGGLAVGTAMKMAAVIPGGSAWELAVAFVILIVVLLVRPQGFFGLKV